MSDLGWTLRWVAPEITEAHPNRPNAVVTGPGVHWHGESVDVVRADLLEVALEALEEIADDLFDGDEAAVSHALQVTAMALERLAGLPSND